MADSSPTRRIKVAIIGLSASAVTSWAASAHLPALLSAEGQQHYNIVALCNSSVTAAEAAIKHFNLPSTTKAYGDSQDLANDPDIDFVICSTRVDKHYNNIVPSIKAGKDVYVEWPVASTLEQVKHIETLAREHNVQVAVGVQGRFAPPIRKIADILEGGKLGKVVGSDLRVLGRSFFGVDTLFPGFEYFADRQLGGNRATILFGHAIDQVQSVLGKIVRGSTTARSSIRYNKLRVIDMTGKTMNTIDNDVPDLIHVTGTLPAADIVADGAMLNATFHSEWDFGQNSVIVWTINCEQAIIRLDVTETPAPDVGPHGEPMTIKIWHFTRGMEIEEVQWSRTEAELKVDQRARDTLGCLIAFAKGNKQGWVPVSEAPVLAEQLETWMDSRSW